MNITIIVKCDTCLLSRFPKCDVTDTEFLMGQDESVCGNWKPRKPDIENLILYEKSK